MTAFLFEAVRPADGGTVRGSLDAQDRPEAVALLSRRGLLPVDVRQAPESRRGASGPSARTQAALLRSLATLVDAGVPLAAALHGVRRVTPGRLEEAVARVEARVREGSSLAAALDSERGSFSEVTVGLVRAAESGVGLAAGLSQAAEDLERRAESVARLRAALAYPLVLLTVGVTSLLAILVLVVPRFAGLLEDVQATLPRATRLLIAGSALVRGHAGLVALALAAVVAVTWTLVLRHRERWHAWLLAWPLVGAIRHSLATARAARTLAALLETGTPALQALRVARQTVGDQVIAARLQAAAERIAQGSALSRALEMEQAFTALALQLAAVGDGAGRMPELLRRAADLEQSTAEQRIRSAIALLEPALILAFAAAVALVAGALLQAVYSLRPGLT